MAQQAPSRRKIPTNPHNRPAAPHELPGGRSPVARRPPGCSRAGRGRAATRGGRPVIELECGITVYPAREEQGRWRAVWHENGERQQCEAASEEKLAARLAKVAEWLEGDAPNMTLRGADLIAFYMSADRLPVQRQWSRKHARTQRRLCERFAVPVIGAVPCQDITTGWAGLPRRAGTGGRPTQPQRPQGRLPGGRLAGRRRHGRVDLAQPAARVLHQGPVYLEARRHRRVPHGRPRQLPHHLGHVRRHHRRRPGPRTATQ